MGSSNVAIIGHTERQALARTLKPGDKIHYKDKAGRRVGIMLVERVVPIPHGWSSEDGRVVIHGRALTGRKRGDLKVTRVSSEWTTVWRAS